MSSQASQPYSRHFDARWIIVFLSLAILLAGTIYLNTNHHTIDTMEVVENIDIDDGDQNINWNHYNTYHIELSDNLTISKSGIYHLTGSLDNGSITINAGNSDVVKLILDNVTIHNSAGPAIVCMSGDDLVVELIGTNRIEDASIYDTGLSEEITGAIYSESDLTFTGDGTLQLVSNHEDGIVTKDDLKFDGGTYDIIAADDAIRGKDSVHIVNGNFIISANSDGIKSTNETDYEKGFILIEDGNFKLSTKAKSIKATRNIIIHGGNYIIEADDDGIHSDDYIAITGGTLNISSGDDGIHANRATVIDGGDITIAKSDEGVEARAVTINDGSRRINSSDDGINAGGNGVDATSGHAVADAFSQDEKCIITINGGNILVNASGDGIDSNGWLYINGGTVVVDGPTNNGNGALDATLGIITNGGEVIAIGSNGMAESLGSSSSIFNISLYLTDTKPANTTIEIKSSTGDTIINHTSIKNFNHIAAGSPLFHLGESYTVYLDNEAYSTFTITGITTTIGNNPNSFRR